MVTLPFFFFVLLTTTFCRLLCQEGSSSLVVLPFGTPNRQVDCCLVSKHQLPLNHWPFVLNRVHNGLSLSGMPDTMKKNGKKEDDRPGQGKERQEQAGLSYSYCSLFLSRLVSLFRSFLHSFCPGGELYFPGAFSALLSRARRELTEGCILPLSVDRLTCVALGVLFQKG